MGNGEVFVIVGEVGRPHGLRGEVRVTPLTDWPDRFTNYRSLFVENSKGLGTGSWLEVRSVKKYKSGFLLKLKGIDTRDDAESLRGCLLKVKEEDCAELPENEYYIHDLVGLEVRIVGGEKIGTLKDVLRMPAQDIFVIDKMGQEILVPAVKDFIKEVNISKGLIAIQPIEGLLGDDED